jgi:hypothetical protein
MLSLNGPALGPDWATAESPIGLKAYEAFPVLFFFENTNLC